LPPRRAARTSSNPAPSGATFQTIQRPLTGAKGATVNKSFQSVLAAEMITVAAKEVDLLKNDVATVEKQLAEAALAGHMTRVACLSRLLGGQKKQVTNLRKFMVEQARLLD